MKDNSEGKIRKLRDLIRIVNKLKKTGKKIVLCHGVFDLIHPGHIRHFAQAKKLGDVLIVTLTGDRFVKKGPDRPLFNQQLRSEVLASISDIDYVSAVDCESAVEIIKKLKPEIYVKGPDYKNRDISLGIPRKLEEEEEAIKSVGGKLIFTDDRIVFSSSRLIDNYLDVYPAKTKDYLDKLKLKYSADAILKKLSLFTNLKILVIGDAIIDQYHYCLPLGKSSKESVMVHRYISEESFLGGTLATANHIASLSRKVTLLTLLGRKKSLEGFIRKNLKPEVQPIFFYRNGCGTIIKRRFLDSFTKQKLFQLSVINDDFLPKKLEKKIIKFLKVIIKKYDLVVVNDYGHGMITDKIIQLICNRAKFLALNVQANSANYGFNVITKYPRADYICIDEQEIRLATHDRFTDLAVLIPRIYKQMKCKHMVITRGASGSISFSQKIGFHEVPALTEKIIDRVGAGDALFAISSPCVYSDMDINLVAFIGNVAGAMQVQTVGNKKQIEFGDMARFMIRLLK